MKTKYTHIIFEQWPNVPNTWKCLNKRTRSGLGIVEFYEQWNCFVFEPYSSNIFSDDCLADIIDFIKQLEKKQ